jgi:uncharacterized membrane protein YtjA (UPF0391 family)
MRRWASLFLIIAATAAVLGFGGSAAAAAGIAEVLFFVCLALFLVGLIIGMTRRRPPSI